MLVPAFVVHGVLAIATIAFGVFNFLRLTAHGAEKVVDTADGRNRRGGS